VTALSREIQQHTTLQLCGTAGWKRKKGRDEMKEKRKEKTKCTRRK
jgi:hypothetical protein